MKTKKGGIPFRDMIRRWARAEIQNLLPERYILEGLSENFGDGLGKGCEEIEFEEDGEPTQDNS